MMSGWFSGSNNLPNTACRYYCTTVVVVVQYLWTAGQTRPLRDTQRSQGTYNLQNRWTKAKSKKINKNNPEPFPQNLHCYYPSVFTEIDVHFCGGGSCLEGWKSRTLPPAKAKKVCYGKSDVCRGHALCLLHQHMPASSFLSSYSKRMLAISQREIISSPAFITLTELILFTDSLDGLDAPGISHTEIKTRA